MKIVITAALAGCATVAAPLCADSSQQTAATPATATADAAKYRAFVDKYCVSCHNQRTSFPADGPVSLDGRL